MSNKKLCPFCGKSYGTVVIDDDKICKVCHAELPIEKEKQQKKNKEEK